MSQMPTQSVHIILAEDEPDVQDFLLRAIQRLRPGVQIVATSDGLQALQVFQEQSADLIISDHRMPNMTGLDFLRAVRAVSAVPFILVSADATIHRQAQQEDVTLFLYKPVKLDTIRMVLTTYLP